ncbi:MAG TPA: ATP-binding cassette domain-containing protein, partial [Burkholderiales bacterium]|nr:ATP-binding cassette domain-containing protein [Burkholderiales bacterium]
MTPAVACADLWKSFPPRRAEGPEGLPLPPGARRAGRGARRWALAGVNLSLAPGRALGVLGQEGSGKTTLLSVLLGTVRPDRGQVSVRGRAAALFELGAGFDPGLTGRENVFLYGALLGMRLSEVRERYARIAEFAGIEGELERPLRAYPAGWIARLRFSVLIHSPAEVLLIDERLAVGDARFREQCLQALREFKRRGGALILASRDAGELAEICDDALVLDCGRVADAGPAAEVLARYGARIAQQEGAGGGGAQALISLLLPTRRRPEWLRRFLESVLARSERPQRVEVVVYADEDDPQSHGSRVEGLEVRTLVGPRASMGDYNTACLERSRGEIVMLVNDDIVIQTRGWDRKLRQMHAAVPDGIYLAYPNDLFKGRGLCAFPVLSRRTCELLGEPFPHVYRGAFIDYHLLDIFKRLEALGHARLIYLEDVIFEHMHYRTGKGEYDDVYRARARFADDDT